MSRRWCVWYMRRTCHRNPKLTQFLFGDYVTYSIDRTDPMRYQDANRRRQWGWLQCRSKICQKRSYMTCYYWIFLVCGIRYFLAGGYRYWSIVHQLISKEKYKNTALMLLHVRVVFFVFFGMVVSWKYDNLFIDTVYLWNPPCLSYNHS